MDIVADASAFLAVVLDETGRNRVINLTAGKSLIAPEILPYEIGNALIAMQKKGRLNNSEVLKAFDLSQRIAVSLMPVKIHSALEIASRFNIYAYDAYYLQCCLENKRPLISLDERMSAVAIKLGIKVLE
jgi:predicted nucleic acid-binding protein